MSTVTTEQLQKFELAILKDFTKVCDKYHLRYFLYGGTLLGAIRHKGFIPWDDDIDIALLWDDYCKLIAILQDEIGDRYFVQNLWTEDKYPCLWTQLRVKNTTSMPIRSKALDIHWGVCIDIFPLISMSDDDKKYNRQLKAFHLAKSFLAADLMKAQNETASRVQRIINLLPTKTRHFVVNRIFNKNASVDKSQTWLGGLDSAKLKRKYKYADFMDRILYEFEGEQFWGPKNGESVLECNYGKAWMTPPPVEGQGGHDLSLGETIVDLEHDYTEYQ